eukprot:8397247-Alexandrium_andersonii.AAC.1
MRSGLVACQLRAVASYANRFFNGATRIVGLGNCVRYLFALNARRGLRVAVPRPIPVAHSRGGMDSRRSGKAPSEPEA